jgi:predicted DNA-binding protein
VLPKLYYKCLMKTLTVRLPDELAKAIEAESRAAGVSKSDVVRRRLEARAHRAAGTPPSFYDLATDLIGSVRGGGQPADLSARKKHYLREWGYGKARRRR